MEDGCVAAIERRAWPHERRSASPSEHESHAVRNPFHLCGEGWVDRGWWHRWDRPREHISMRAGEGRGGARGGIVCESASF